LKFLAARGKEKRKPTGISSAEVFRKNCPGAAGKLRKKRKGTTARV